MFSIVTLTSTAELSCSPRRCSSLPAIEIGIDCRIVLILYFRRVAEVVRMRVSSAVYCRDLINLLTEDKTLDLDRECTV